MPEDGCRKPGAPIGFKEQPGPGHWHGRPRSAPYPLSVSWPRRRTRCTSLWSTPPLKRLAWYCWSPVWPLWTTERHSARHPSSVPDPIGCSGCRSDRAAQVSTARCATVRSPPQWSPSRRIQNPGPDQVPVCAPDQELERPGQQRQL